jgi:NAD(P)-dependent dehydrogenase (short-subunit alcohol dehydrogenase family)
VELRTYRADLSSLADVRGLADEVLAAEERLDVLVNNAGIGTGDGRRETSVDGYELRFAVNYLAGYVLAERLLPLLERSGPARIVNVASAAQHPIDFDDVMLERGYSGGRAYSQSKLAQILHVYDLAERLGPDARVTATALHPATYMPTKIVHSPISTLEEGVAATRHLVDGADVAGVTGRYFNGLHVARPDRQAEDPAARRRLRELSARLTGVEPVSR